MATSAGEGTSYQGGAGGKFRKKPFKKPQTTPYDRPTTAFQGNSNTGWVSKMIVGPASKLISASAQLFFSSVRNRILTPTLPPPPPPPSGSKQESRDRFQEAVLLSPVKDHGQLVNDRGKQGISEDQRHDIKNNGKQMQTTDTTGLSELEIMLKQNTFSKSEIDRLTALLRSRTVELPNGHGEKNSEFIHQETLSTLRGMDYFSRSSLPATRKESPLDNQLPKDRLAVSSKVLEEDVASPAELAKAYMENRSSKISPSMREEDIGVPSDSPFASKSLIRKPTPHNGFLENGFSTPKSQGRSAIYTMARTPYPRLNPTASHKGNSSIFNPSNGPSASPSTGFARELVARSVSKDLAMKRRSSVLDEEIGSVGPIRRLRQKTNLSTPKNTSSPFSRTSFSSNGNGIVSNGALDPSSISKTFQGNEDYNEYMPGTSHTPIPSQSKETANKILQQLQKLTPKEKQFEGKIGALTENSPTKLTPSMLHGQALRSLENVDSSKFFQGADYSVKYMKKKPSSPDVCETSSKGKDKIQENEPKSINISHGSLNAAETSCGMGLSKDAVPAFLISEPVKKQTITQSPPKKGGFQMSAHEDFFEFDDELQSSEADASAKITEDKKISEKSTVETKAVPVTEDKTTSVSEIKAPMDSFVFGKPTDLGTSDETKVVEKNNGFLFPAPAASTCSSPVVSVSQSTKNVNNFPEKEQNVSLLFNSGAENDKKVSSFSSSFLGGSEGWKSAPSVEVKQENTNSLATNTSSTTETVPKPADSDNDVIKNIQKSVDTLEKPANLFSLPEPLSTVGSNHSFSSLTNGSLNSTTPSILSSPSPIIPTTNSENKTLPNPFTDISFLNKNSSAASSEATESTSAAATSSSFLSPIFNFQPTTTTSHTPSLTTTPEIKSNSSFIAPPTYSTIPTISNATDLKTSTEKKEPANPFSSISSPIPATGNGIFGFSSGSNSSSSAAANNISQNSIFGTNNSSSSATTQSLPVFDSSSSSSFSSSTSTGFIFGGNGTSTGSTFSSSTSSSFQFGPSTPSKDTVTTPGFGLGTSAPSSSLFSFSAPSSQSSIFGSSTGPSTPPVFSFNSGSQTNPIFGNNSNNMTMAEDSMAEDSMVHAGSTPTPTLSPPSMPVFGQPIGSNPSPNPFMFGSNPAVSSAGVVPNPFQFGGQQFGGQQFGGQPVQTGTQIPNPFQQSASGLDLSGIGGGGSSFSLGSGGDDKSNRRVIKIKNRVRRK